jgi:hypothetical protein
MIRTFLLTAALACTGAVLAAPAADAKPVTVKCPEGRYGDNNGGEFPVAYNVKATGLPAKTDGYAPRCLVAWSGVGFIRSGWNGRTGTPPKTVHLQGASWDGGVWRVRLKTITTDDGAYGKFTLSRGSKRITFEGGS